MSRSKIMYATALATAGIILGAYSQISDFLPSVEYPAVDKFDSYGGSTDSKIADELTENDGSSDITPGGTTVGVADMMPQPSFSAPSFDLAWKGNFSIIIPNSVLVNETFDLQYTWTKITDDLDEIYIAACRHDYTTAVNSVCAPYSDTDNFAVVVRTELEFINMSQKQLTLECTKAITDNIDIMSEDIFDRSGKIGLKFTKMPNTHFHPTSIMLFSFARALATIDATDGGNGTINLAVSALNDYNLPENICQPYDPAQGANSPGTGNTNSKQSTMDLNPSCIHQRLWTIITEDERNAILDNSTTCQVINGEQITNLPPIGYQLVPKDAFEGTERLIGNHEGGLEEFFLNNNLTDPEWIKEFTSYYNSLSKQSHNFFFQLM